MLVSVFCADRGLYPEILSGGRPHGRTSQSQESVHARGQFWLEIPVFQEVGFRL